MDMPVLGAVAALGANEASLCEQLETLSSIIARLRVGVALQDQESRLLLVNQAYCDIVGYAESELIGQSLEMLLLPEERELQRAHYLEFLSVGRGRPHELIVLHKNGTRRILWQTPAVWRRDDGRGFVIISVEDITEEKRMEELLIHDERLLAAGMLARGVAHHYSNLSTGIKGFLELVIRDENLSPKGRARLSTVVSNLKAMDQLTDQVCAFSGNRQARKIFTPLSKIVEDVLQLVRPTLEEDAIRIKTRIEATEPMWLDASQIGEVMLNLLFNAQEALAERENRRVIVCCGQLGCSAYVEIADNGCGIPREAHSKIFLPFFTTKGEFITRPGQKKRDRNPGMGLSISNTFVANHGGMITVGSEPERGSTFSVWLPIKRTHPVYAGLE